MAAKSKSPVGKVIAITFVLLAVGGLLFFKMKAGKQKQVANLNQLEDEISELVPQVDSGIEKVSQLADQGKIDEALLAGNETLDKIDTIQNNHSIILGSIGGSDKKTAQARKGYFDVYRKVVQKMMECIQFDPQSAQVKKCKAEFAPLAAEMQTALNEYEELRGQ